MSNDKKFVRTLECSSKGHKAYSAFYAKLPVFGKIDTIENHYQLSKRFGNEVPITWRDAKGKQPTHFVIKGKSFDLKYLSDWYTLMWIKYLDNHPELVEYASQFDEFTDMFSVPTCNCQAVVIKRYIKEGRDVLLKECREFINELKKI